MKPVQARPGQTNNKTHKDHKDHKTLANKGLVEVSPQPNLFVLIRELSPLFGQSFCLFHIQFCMRIPFSYTPSIPNHRLKRKKGKTGAGSPPAGELTNGFKIP